MYRVEDPVQAGDATLILICRTQAHGHPTHRGMRFFAEKRPVWVVVLRRQALSAFDLVGHTSSLAEIEARVPDLASVIAKVRQGPNPAQPTGL